MKDFGLTQTLIVNLLGSIKGLSSDPVKNKEVIEWYKWRITELLNEI